MRILSEEFVEGRRYIIVSGDSDETKPSENICDGSVFIESDTAVVSFYNETASDWIPVTSSSGGDES